MIELYVSERDKESKRGGNIWEIAREVGREVGEVGGGGGGGRP